MKKNRMMRLASILLVCVLMTTSVISGTFAKYVTTDSASDTARVAKWGVTALVSGSLFGENYYAFSDTEATSNKIAASTQQSVDVSSTGGNIVAPGTTSDEGLRLAISGTPEVANTVTVEAVYQPNAQAFKTIFLAEGTYATLVKAQGVTADNMTDYYVNNNGSYTKATGAFDSNTTYYELHDEVTVANGGYYPIEYTWTEADQSSATYKNNINADTDENTTTLLEDIQAYFTSYPDGQTQNNPNVSIAKSGTLTWAWDFSTSGNDGKDTILGNLMAQDNDQVVVKKAAEGDTYSAPTVNSDYCLDIDFGVKITVTQVN